MNLLYTAVRKVFLCAFLLLSLHSTVKSQTTLAAGDLAFSGYVSNDVGADRFSFVLLANVSSGTTIKFTDYGWRTDLNAFSSGTNIESELTFVTNAAYAAGTEIMITGSTATLVGGASAGTITYSTGANFVSPISLSSGGDQIFAYQGTFASPTFISGIHMNVYATVIFDPTDTDDANWDGVVVAPYLNSTTSGKPASLTTGVNCIWIGTFGVSASEMDNAVFNCASATLGTAAQVRAALNDKTKWFANNSNPAGAGYGLPTACSFITAIPAPVFTTNPSTVTVCDKTGTSFTAAASNATGYQWQVNTGAGFNNISDNNTYSGTATNTLTIPAYTAFYTGATVSMSGYLYRCVASNGSGSANSAAATLNVTALPQNPTILLKTPAANFVADGTPVSATFTAGSGGTGCGDSYRYTVNNGVSYLPYTPGANISTTGLAATSGYVFIEVKRDGCTSLCQNSYVAAASWYVTPLPTTATTLAAGDIAFTGYTSTNVIDEFSFVLLKNIGPGTVINFTDNGWNPAGAGSLQTGEQTINWTSNAAYPAGTEIRISGTTATLAAGGSAGTVGGTALSLTNVGDQVLAYQGLSTAPVFISGIHMNVYTIANGDGINTTAAAWDGTGTANTSSNCALPPGLTTGVNAIWIGTQGVSSSEYENARYGNCSLPATFGSIATLRAAINDQNNWIRDHSTPPGFTLPTGCLYFGLGTPPNFTTNPSNSTVCAGVSTSFTAVAGGAITYQWQVNTGSGFVNLNNDLVYNGVNATTLSINAPTTALNGYQYRLVASNVSGSVNSTAATLTVNPVPAAPALASKSPAALVVADGTNVSATFAAGSGGTGCTDDYRYSINGGTTYLPYTPGTNISTTGVAAGAGFVFIQGRRANCTSSCQGAYTLLASWQVSPLPTSATTLNAGDIAFSGYVSQNIPDEFSFVLLKTIGPGTAINFTDNGWLSATAALQTAEQTCTWTSNAAYAAGTEIKIVGTTATLANGGGSAGTVTGSALSLSTGGDQVLAYRGLSTAPTFISAIHMNVYTTLIGDPAPSTTAAAWDGTANTQSSSALPPGLTTGVNAIWIGTQDVTGSEYDNARFSNCSAPGVTGDINALRLLLNNQANWIRDNNLPPSFTLPANCNFIFSLCPTITVTNPVIATGTVGTAFSQTFTSTGGAPTVTYIETGALPAGISFSTAGVLSGTPTVSGSFPVTVTAIDGNGCSGNGSTYTLVISCQAMSVTNPAVTTGQQNTPFSQSFSQTGGNGAITFTLNSGSLPAGLTLSTAGVLSGTPTASGTFNITVRATDINGCFANGATYTLVINACPVITVTNPATTTGTITVAYSQSFSAAGGVTPYTYSTASALPAGLTLSSAGVLSGTPTSSGSFPIVVTATDNNLCTGNGSTYTLVISCQTITVSNPANTAGTAGTAFSENFSSAGGVPTVTYSTASTLPAGLTLSSAGVLSGTPTAAGTFPVAVTATDNNGCTGTGATYNLVISCPAPMLGTATPSSQSRCSGLFVTPIILGGSLPAGTSYNWTRDFTGTIGGSIPASGSGNISGSLTNNTGAPVTVTFTITPVYYGTCTGTPYTATVTVNPLPLATINGTAPALTVCESGTTLSATTDPNYTYAWGISNFTAPFTPIGTAPVQPITHSGVILLTVTNQYGCIDTAMTSVNVADYVFNGSLAAGDAVMTGRLNRFAVISTCASPKACPGIFTTVGNRLYDSYTIANPRNVPVCATIGLNSFCGTNIFSVAYYAFNPTSLCSNYLADPGSSPTTSIYYEATIPANGSIVVIVHEVNTGTGCGSYRLTVDLPRDASGITVSPSASVCTGTPVTLTAPVANSYSWSPGGATTQSITVNTANTYSVALGYGNNGCTDNLSQVVTVNPAPDVTTVSNMAVCNGSTVTAAFTGSQPGTVFNWTNSNPSIGLAASGNGDLNFTAANATAGPVSGTITVTPSLGSCTGTPMTFTITVLQQPMITGVTNGAICAPGGSVNLSAAGSGTINWYSALTGGNLLFTGNNYSPNVSSTTTYYAESQVVSAPVSTLAMPGQSSTFPGNVRGYWFTAPSDFVITALRVPATASSSPQQVAVVKFNGNTPPPVFSATTNAFTTLFLTRNNTSVSNIAVNIPIHAGEVIGLLGNRGDLNSYAPGDYVTTINGSTVQLERLGMQFPLSTTDPRDIWREFGAGTSISRIEFEYAQGACNSAPRVPVTATVKPLPVTTATPSSQTICSGSAITNIALGSDQPGSTFSWTRDNTATVTGIAASGNTDISGTLVNTTNAPITVTFTITSSFNGCSAIPVTATVIVNPIPSVNSTPDKVVCNGDLIPTISFTGSAAGTVYNWTNNLASIGLASSGTGDITAFNAVNNTAATVTATITVTPSFTNGGTTCTGTSASFTIQVKPSNSITLTSGVTTAAAIVNPDFELLYKAGSTTVTSPLFNTSSFAAGTTNTGMTGPTVTFSNNTTGNTFDMAGWVWTSNMGVTNENNNFGSPRNMIAWFNGASFGGGTAEKTMNQTLGESLQQNVTYTLSADFGWRNDNPVASVPPVLRLYAGATLLTPVTVVSPALVKGSFVTYTNTYNINNPGISGPLRIELGLGANTTAQQLNADHVTLSKTSNTVQSVCINTPITNITYATTSATGATFSGLPAGVNGVWASNVVTISGTPTVAGTFNYTVTLTGGCGVVTATGTITVNAVPTVTATPASQTICNATAITPIVLNGSPVSGTVYNWTRNNTTVTGIAASGSGLISGTLTNTTSAPVTVTFTITATANGCTSAPITATVTVNPTATINAVSNQVVCNGANTTAVTFSSPTTGGTIVYNWTNNTPSIGLASSGSGNIASFVATNAGNAPVTAAITVTPAFTNGAVTCNGTPVTFTITVNPTATVTAVANQTVCNGSATAAVNFTSPTTGGSIVYNWTNNNTSIGLAAGGSGNIASFNGINTGTAPVTATITVTPSYTNGAVTCIGTPRTFTITVNPTAVTNFVANQTVCNGAPTTAITFSSTATGGSIVYNWTNNNTSIGLASGGTGNIASFNGVNPTNAPVTATITVTAAFTNNGVTCNGTPITFTITVNPTPTVNAVANQTVCNGSATTAVSFTGFVPGTVYNWTNSDPSIGLTASGTGDIASFIGVNAGNAPVTAAITVTPSYTNSVTTCLGAPITFTITVNPTATVNAVANQTVCNGSPTTAVTISGPVAGAVYNWTNNNPAIGLGASGTGTVPSFNGSNNGLSPVTATITVTPTYTNGGVTCTGPSSSFTITVNPAPSVISVPNQVVCNNSATTGVTFSSSATGGTIVYNWTNNNTSIGLAAGGTGSVPSFIAANAANAPVTATITVIASYTNNGVTCTGPANGYTITVNPTPAANAVANQAVCNGAGFVPFALGGSVPGAQYFWTNNNTSIGLGAGGSGTIPTFIATNPTNAPVTATITVTPSYTNGGTTCTGTPVTFTITVNPTPVANAIANQAVCVGSASSPVPLNGTVSGTVYTWTNNNTAIGLGAGGTGTIPPFTGTNTTNAPITGIITVTASYTNAGITCTGAPVTFSITINPIPAMNAVVNQTVCNGGTTSVSFVSNVSGAVYSWTNNTPSIGIGASGTGNIPVFTAVNTGTAPVTATFTVTPSYATCSGTPITFTITVNPSAAIATQPANTAVCEGLPATFTVAATGVNLTYQWQVNTGAGFVNIPSANAASYSTVPVTTLMNGYLYRVIAGSACGTVTSAAATLTVNTAPVFTVQPVNTTGCIGGSVTFTSTAFGTGVGFQWEVNTGSGFLPVAGATSQNYTVTGLTAAMNGYQYHVIATGVCAPGATSNTVTLTVNAPTIITAQPASVSVCQGLNAVFSVSATGTALTYQWQVNTGSGFVNIPGATSATLTLTAPPVSASGNQYRVIVTGLCGPVISATATLTVFNLDNIDLSAIQTNVCYSDTVITLKATPAGGVWSGNGISGNLFDPKAAGIGVSLIKYTVSNANGCVSVREIAVTVTSCPERLGNLEYTLSLYPNPNHGQFAVRLLSDIHTELNLTIVDAAGRIIKRWKATGLHYGSLIPVDLRTIASGTYRLMADDKGDHTSKGFVVLP